MERFLRILGGILAIASLAAFLTSAGNLVLDTAGHPNIFKSILWLSPIAGLLGVVLFKNKFFRNSLKAPWRYLFGDRHKSTEDRIQQEIIKQVLEAARLKTIEIQKEEETTAILDALEEVVDLPRAEIDRIAEKVRQENTQAKSVNRLTSHLRRLNRAILPWLTGLLGIMTFLLIRRGSGWYLFTGALLILAIINMTIIYKSKKEE